ncbi:siderophore-interacting protein [Saccharopolyspora rosea]|uniref:Siderophore-interacting protein n=1 Tax=Saccharopolyspora rosea TaxID=524884 RepID=A0ABW3G0A4_9PSEU|nr:siderophore-interacting protein [Saccharopolyspora rosea]
MAVLARPAYRTFEVEVVGVRRLGPSFARITFGGAHGFGAGGDDQRIKILLPRPGCTVADLPSGDDWYRSWLAIPEPVRPVARTYTVRAFRPETGELDVDFVLHGDGAHSGPASAWAAAARPGDRIGLVGPDRPGRGQPWGCEWAPPSTASRLVIAGDETAVPAVAAIVEGLPADARGVACLEIPDPADRQDWNTPRGLEIRWLARGRAPHGERLVHEVTDVMAELHRPGTTTGPGDADPDGDQLWDVPEPGATPGRLYGWLAGEAGAIRTLRRLLVHDHGVPRGSVAFMGYWRLGHR